MNKTQIFMGILVSIFIVICNCEKLPEDATSHDVLSMTVSIGPDDVWSQLLYGDGGKKVIWVINVINCSDSSARNISLWHNSSKYPFYKITEMAPHKIMQINRSMYKPKILHTDTIICRGIQGGKEAFYQMELDNVISLTGEYMNLDDAMEY